MKANASKKVLTALLAVCMALALVACGGTEAPGSAAASGSTAASESSGPASTASQSEPASSQADPSAYTVTFEVPEGFEAADASQTGAAELYVADDGSNVNVVILDNPGGGIEGVVTQEMMTASIEQGLEAQTGTDVALNDVEFSTYHVGPCEAYRISYTVELNGLNIMQICVGVSTDKAYTISYTDMTGGSRADVFEQSVASIAAVEA